jgi:SAM-dependent methyltransferase
MYCSMTDSNTTPAELSKRTFDEQYHRLGMRAQRAYPNESLIQFIAGAFFALSDDERRKVRILELGCGSGANLWMLAKERFDCYGIDSSAKAIALATAHLTQKWGVEAKLEVGSFAKLPYQSQFFDAVIDVVSLQHLDLAASTPALDEVARVLKPSGRFFSYRLSDHSTIFAHEGAEHIDAATLRNIRLPTLPLANNGPISFWSPVIASQMYQRSGLSIHSLEKFARTYQSGVMIEYLSIAASLI